MKKIIIKNIFITVFLLIVLVLILVIINYKNNYYRYKDYENNKKIFSSECHRANISTNIDSENNITCNIGKLGGIVEVAQTYVENATKTTVNMYISANSGRAKIILIRSEGSIDILKEIIAKKKDQNFDISLSINFTEGINKIKIVGDNFSGNFKIIQNEKIKFKLAKDFKNDFGDNFPFNKN
jgi:aspartokinase